jgi:hypothetical protein
MKNKLLLTFALLWLSRKVFSKDLTGFRRVLVNQVGFYAQIPD